MARPFAARSSRRWLPAAALGFIAAAGLALGLEDHLAGAATERGIDTGALAFRTRLPGLSADETITVPPPATGAVPVPVLVVTGTELYNDFEGTPYVRYRLRVANAYAIPDSFFAGPYSCDPGQVSVFSGDDDTYIYGFCGGGEDPDLARNALYNVIWFGIRRDATPPATVYIELYDTKTGERYPSTVAKVPGAPPASENGILSATIGAEECRPSAIAGACQSSGLSSEPGFSLEAEVTYNYDGAWGSDAQMTATILWTYGTCLIDTSQLVHPVAGQPSVSTLPSGTDFSTVSNCASIPSITDRIYAVRVCLSDGGVPNVATDCIDVPYEREVTFARE